MPLSQCGGPGSPAAKNSCSLSTAGVTESAMVSASNASGSPTDSRARGFEERFAEAEGEDFEGDFASEGVTQVVFELEKLLEEGEEVGLFG